MRDLPRFSEVVRSIRVFYGGLPRRLRLGRLTREALRRGHFTHALVEARDSTTTHFAHFLDIPLYLVIVSPGTTKPTTWTLFFASGAVALGVAVVPTLAVPRLHPWTPQLEPQGA